ncbi:hypothetical protein RHMOL_Rhmol03G0140600 [Rhododendron molle]|uniref:Uncharacterized protein n=1 Tax=Rhododendron molle TaxID=49168 RepID=A0ACC0PFB8_RHOML|nr:hypothetical protein RHMOL_Rhmol03G0140600 [Rhododendron molle]
MVVELSSDSSSSLASSLIEIPKDILEAVRIRAFYQTPIDHIEPVDPSSAPREVTSFDPQEIELPVNSYRIITSIIKLRRQFNLTFGLEELFRVYLVGVSRENARYYLSSRMGYDMFLIDHLPDSEEWASIYVSVSENFMFGPRESIDTVTTVQFETGTLAEGVVQELRERAVQARITIAYAIPVMS